MTPTQLVTADQIAQWTHLDRSTIYRLIEDNDLPAVRGGNEDLDPGARMPGERLGPSP